MITPGLVRRSLWRAAQWRLLVLQLALLAVSTFVAVHPISGFLQAQFNLWPHAHEAMAKISPTTLIELLLQIMSPAGGSIGTGMAGALLLALLFGPIFAGAILAVAQSDETLHSRSLLEGAAHHYGRMLRMLFAGLIPLGIAGAIIAGLNKWSMSAQNKALTEAAENSATRTGMALSMLAVFLALLWLDAARAQFAAQPQRRSAFLALFAGGWLFVRRPLRAVAIGLATGLLAEAGAALFLIFRQAITQNSSGKLLVALVLSQIALAFLAWGRAARLLSFAELARADQLDRAKPPASSFEMAPPKTSPPPPVAPLAAPAIELPPPDEAAIVAAAPGAGTSAGSSH